MDFADDSEMPLTLAGSKARTFYDRKVQAAAVSPSTINLKSCVLQRLSYRAGES